MDDDDLCSDCFEPLEDHCEICQECSCEDGECEEEV